MKVDEKPKAPSDLAKQLKIAKKVEAKEKKAEQK